VVEVVVVGLFHLYFYPDVDEVAFGACEFLHQYLAEIPCFRLLGPSRS